LGFLFEIIMKRNFSRKTGRLIIIDNIQWKWKVGKSGFVFAHSQNGQRLFDHADKITGRDFERGQQKRTSDGMVTPADIENWIKKF